LIEHQSTPEELMPFRILQYTVSIMNHHLTKTGKKQLPIVYPLVFYNGWKPYNYSTDIFDLFGDKKELAKDILWGPCQLIDLSKIPDKKLRNHLFYGVFAYTMKHIYKKDFAPILKNIIDDLKHIERQGEMGYIYKTLSYIVEASEIKKEIFINNIKDGLSTINEEKLMTLAEQFRQEGKQQGIQEGLHRGKEEALKTVAMNLLSQGLSVDKIVAATGLSAKEIKSLQISSVH
jgi:predicted transposase/invertase (TIGR01784 family)